QCPLLLRQKRNEEGQPEVKIVKKTKTNPLYTSPTPLLLTYTPLHIANVKPYPKHEFATSK
ncbi:hypothetical protein ACJMK2_015551, partial [Sinanodonta woodiana]